MFARQDDLRMDFLFAYFLSRMNDSAEIIKGPVQ